MSHRAIRLLLALCCAALALGGGSGGLRATGAAAVPSFRDVATTDPAFNAVTQLATRGIIKGCDQTTSPPLFCPIEHTLRAQMAALIARAMGWDTENHGNTFPDQCKAPGNCIDPDLWRNVGTLQFYGVAKGYPDGTYDPFGDVLYAQTVSFITRAMVRKGYWTEATVDDGSIYPNIPASSGHRLDFVTYVQNVGPVPDTTTATQTLTNWNQPSTRAWFARALWQALRVSFGVSATPIQTVFVILMENHNWGDIKGSASAPYLNGTLLPQAAHAEQDYNPPALHPSEPNYIWLEAGDNLGIRDDADPSVNHQATTSHLVTQLQQAGVPWRTYLEGIDGTTCPLTPHGHYTPRHNPMLYFDDVTDTNNLYSANCLAHVRPYGELATDLAANRVGGYNFITPDLCDDTHDNCTGDAIKQGDDWLSHQVPLIQSSLAYKDGGAIFITWDEGEGGSDGPIGLLALSPLAKPGYQNTIHYTHSSLVRTVQTIFGVRPFLRDAANATDLRDLFAVPFPATSGDSPAPLATIPAHTPPALPASEVMWVTETRRRRFQ